SLCEQIKSEHIAPLTFTGRYPGYALRGFYFPWVISLGGLEVLNRAQNLEPGAWKDPAFVRAAEYVVDFKRKGYFQSGCIGMNHTESQMEFLVGRAAMIPCGTWLHSEMANLLPSDFVMEFMLCPVFEDGKGEPSLICANLNGHEWFIGSKSKHPDLAADFFRYIASPQNARRFVEQKGTLMSVVGLGEVNAPPHLLKPLEYVESAKGTWSLDYEEWYPEMGTEIQNLFRDLYNNLLTPEQFVEQMEKQAEKVRSDSHIQKFKVP
ncbi:MAG TPA: extracellular solute-binding protein, partial [bacterium]|nr:extracellular solute-binding protein [bacterium]